MRLEFIKEERADQTVYYTEKNGSYVDGSLSSNPERAMQIFDRMVENRGVLKKTTTLKSIIIDGETGQIDLNNAR